jgi:UDP-N-acetylglucosamine 2-epimerase (non-hydrolysing)
MLKVVTLVGTRPELIKLSLVIGELDKHCRQVLVHTGQNHDFELNEVFFKDFGLRKPDHFLDVAGESPAEAIAKTIERFDKVLEQEQPDAMLLLGDTNSGLGVIAAKRRKIAIFHMEAGNRCFDQRVPEEINRRIIDHTSDINLVYTEHARRYLLAEGIRPDTVIKTGSPMREVLTEFSGQIEDSDVLERLELSPGDYFVVSAHRQENVDEEVRLRTLMASLASLVGEFGKRVIFSVHPRTRAKLDALECDFSGDIHFMKPVGFFDYIKLQKNAFCVVSDSGTITEEASILGFPAVTIREAHGRPEGMDEGSVIMTGLESDRILDSVRVATSQRQSQFQTPVDYSQTNVSKKIVRIMLSYTNFIRRTTWFEPTI